MLDVALNYADELIKKERETWFKDKYKFYHGNYCGDLNLVAGTYDAHQFVSVGEKGDVIGYISYKIDRCTGCCYDFCIVNYTGDRLTFGKDVLRTLTDIFDKYHFNKLEFCVVIGNPAEKSYDRLIKKYGGSVVGIFREHTKLTDGLMYDVKVYEVLSYDYRRARINKVRGEIKC